MKTNTIYCGDSLELLKKCPAESVDLVFADPPYNIGYVYDKYSDDRPDDEYVAWCRAWMEGCTRALRASGSFYLAIGDDFAAELCVAGKSLGLTLRNWIVWHYNFGQNMKAKFTRAHTHILYFVKDPDQVIFNADQLRFPSARHTEYQDKRANPKGRLPDDVWDEFPRVCGTFKERDGYHGCQMPEALLTRVIHASSNPGGLVLDPFMGSGTTAAVAKRLGRDYLGFDLSEEYVRRTRKRLAEVQDESRAVPDENGWPRLHTDLLLQIYRETKVSLENLLANAIAMEVIAGALAARCGHHYTVDEISQELQRCSATCSLPKLPNDRAFSARKRQEKAPGAGYQRRVTRHRSRKSAAKVT